MYLGAKRRYINTLPFLSFPLSNLLLGTDRLTEERLLSAFITGGLKGIEEVSSQMPLLHTHPSCLSPH